MADRTEEALRRVGEKLDRLTGSTNQFDFALGSLNKAYVKIDKEIAKSAEEGKKHAKVLDRLIDRHRLLTGYINNQARVLKAWGATAEEATASLSHARDMLAQTTEAMHAQMTKQTGDWMSALEKAGGAQGLFVGTIQKTVGGIAQMRDGLSSTAKTVAEFTGMGPKMSGLVAILASFGAVIANELMNRFMEGRKIVSNFGGEMAATQGGILRWTQTLRDLRPATLLLGVSSDDLGAAYKALTNSYALSISQASRFGMGLEEYAKQSSLAITRTLAMGRAIGMTDQETHALISTFGILGENLADSDILMARVAAQAERLGMPVADLAKNLELLAPANLFAGKSTEYSLNALTRFGNSILTNVNDPILKTADRAKIAAQAMRSLAEASARLDLPQMLAFGAAMDGFTGTMDEALTRVQGMKRTDIVAKAFKGIETMAEPGQKLMAKTLLASTMGIGNLNDQFGMALGNFNAIQGQGAAQLTQNNEAVEKMSNLLDVAKAQSLGINQIVGILKAAVSGGGWGAALNLLTGGGGTAGPGPGPVTPAPPTPAPATPGR